MTTRKLVYEPENGWMIQDEEGMHIPASTCINTCAFMNAARLQIQEFYSGRIEKKLPGIEKVISQAPATIVIWDDGSKTVVKCGDHDTYDPEKGLAICIAKKALGNKGSYYNVFRKYLMDAEGERSE